MLGRWPFRSLELAVDRRVLIPRPETEQVVEVALAELASLIVGHGSPDRAVPGTGPVAVDLGTGSGAIALSLAVEGGEVAPGLVVWATDASADALEVAAWNRDELARRDPEAAGRVRLSAGRWFDALPAEVAGTVDLLVSNPPYVAEAEFARLDPTVSRWEPRDALVAADAGGVGGMADIEAVVAGAPHWLRSAGALVVEIDPAQADATLDAVHRAGFARSGTAQDLAGRVRMVVARAMTMRLEPLAVDAGSLARAAKELRAGAVVAVPTDTVYGLAADLSQPQAVAQLFTLKERPAEVALPVLVDGLEQVSALAGPLDRRGGGPGRAVLARPADPGGPAAAHLHHRSRGAVIGPPDRRDSVARPCGGPFPVPRTGAPGGDQRQPTRRTTRGHGPRGGGPLRATDDLALILDGGLCDGTPSTVVECQGSGLRCLREGAIPWAVLLGGPRAGRDPG